MQECLFGRTSRTALLAVLLRQSDGQLSEACGPDTCAVCCSATNYNCSLPGQEFLTPGQYHHLTANYLSFATETSSPNLLVRAREFQECTGGRIVFSEALNIWEDPIRDLGTKDSPGLGIYHGYMMSYSHYPEASYLGLVEALHPRLARSNEALQWESVFPQVQRMGRYRRNGTDQLDFLMYDGDFFVPIVRLDLLERDNVPLPNTWDEALAVAARYNGTDLNEDGEPDFGFCHFPRQGAGYWDWWWAEIVYAIWATYSQTQDTSQGFLFDKQTMKPNLDRPGFREAARIMKSMWKVGADGCISDSFSTGRCAIGFAPPGCWKGIFLNGIGRKNSSGHVIWQPTMQDGSYADPYRFKPFGSTRVEADGVMKECTDYVCPHGEAIPLRGHHGPNDRARVLPPSPLAGRRINRAPFFWSGGLGLLIRRSAPEALKDMLWDFMVYTNSPHTADEDVAKYASWLDSWRSTQLPPDGANFLEAGWSQEAYAEHRAVMLWALSETGNGAFNLRLPGAKVYTLTVLATDMAYYIADAIDETELIRRVDAGWRSETQERGKLDQLAIYRATLGLDELSEYDLCLLHREEMDSRDPTVCPLFFPNSDGVYLTALVVILSLMVFSGIFAGVAYVYSTAQAKKRLLKEKEEQLENTVQRGLSTVKELGYPMSVIRAKDFVELSSDMLESCHEGLRDLGLLRVLDSTEEISHFHMMGNHIVFFSYHWPSWDRFGPDNIQRRAMDHALELFGQKVGASLETIFVWLDIVSIPQKHRGVQVLAINSLYVYASSVDALIIIAPPTLHEQTGESLGLDTYKTRVWTRVEQVAHLSAHGIDSLFFYKPTGLEPVDLKWMEDVVRVFDGQTTCCHRRHENFGVCDREQLVLPLIGLYYRVAAAERRGVDSNEGTGILYGMMQRKREAIFPRTFDHVSLKDGVEVKKKKVLFGDLLERVDIHLEHMNNDVLLDFVRHPTGSSSMSPTLRRGGLSPGGNFPLSGTMSAGLAERIERHRGLSDISVGDDSDYREYEAQSCSELIITRM